MADTKKRLSGDYTIATPTDGTITLDTGTLAGTVVVTGNLVVHGVQTVVESTTTTVVDPIITLNQGESGSGVTAGQAGIEVDRGSGTDVKLIWNETVKRWQISDHTNFFANIASTNTSFLPNVSADPAPTISGNLDVQGYQIYSSSTDYVTFTDNVAIANSTTLPSALASNVVLAASTIAGGGSGLYVVNAATAGQELITKNKAIVYSLIF
jgi:hypothetical protein